MGNRVRTVTLSTGIAVVLCVPLALSVTAEATSEVLLSRGRPAVASSIANLGYSARNAVDSNAGTRWASVTGPGTQWLRVDLGGVQTVNRVKILWQAAYATAYAIQTSTDGASWTNVHATKAGNGAVDDLRRLNATARYLRILVTRRATPYGYSLQELQVFGPGPAAPLPTSTTASGPGTVPTTASGLTDPKKKELALELVSTAENSTLNWRGQFGYIEDIGDGRGYTAGIVGFCSGTSDMLVLVTEYTRRSPANRLARYLPALRTVDGSDSHAGLGPGFVAAWRLAAADPVFQKAQEDERDRMYFNPAVAMASADGVRALGQFAYFDAAVMHGISGLRGIRAQALLTAKTPRLGGEETVWLDAFLDARVKEMKTEEAHSDVSRVENAQRVFLRTANLDLNRPLAWKVYGDPYSLG